MVARISEADQDPASSGVADYVGQGFASEDVEGLLRLSAEPKRLTADHQVRLQLLRLARLADETPELGEQAARGRPGQRESKNGLPHRLRRMDRQLLDVTQAGGDRFSDLLPLEDLVD